VFLGHQNAENSRFKYRNDNSFKMWIRRVCTIARCFNHRGKISHCSFHASP